MPPRRGQKKGSQIAAATVEDTDEVIEDTPKVLIRGSKVTDKLATGGEIAVVVPEEGNLEPETSLENPEDSVPDGEDDEGIRDRACSDPFPGLHDRHEAVRDSSGRAGGMPQNFQEEGRQPYPEDDVHEVIDSLTASTPDAVVDGSGNQSDAHAEKRIMGAAATLGGAAGMLLAGPMAGATLGAAAAYATTRESSVGRAARRAGAAYLQVADRAVDKGFQLADAVCDEGRRRISRQLEAADGMAMPQPLKAGLTHLSGRLRGDGICEPPPEEREEASRMQRKYPGRVPVMCERSPYSDLPQIARTKFVVPGSMLCGEFKYIVHKHVAEALREKFRAEQTVYIFVNGIALKTGTSMAELYHQLAPLGGFLHVRYGAENTLGWQLAAEDATGGIP
mmetsp:Transcript_66952/g.160346  ORF Transcript_66952/g.160346 Transcript_66952/m.160346 type:complete len:393 (-) Transcript_66952:116-1294(-)